MKNSEEDEAFRKIVDLCDAEQIRKFMEHIWDWEKLGVPYSYRDMIELANKYNVPVPKP